MGASTHVETVRTAKKPHKCSWCPEKIGDGESYKRYRWFSDGNATVVKMHPECYEAMLELADAEGGQVEFTPHSNSRGCSCDNSGDCKGCCAP